MDCPLSPEFGGLALEPASFRRRWAPRDRFRIGRAGHVHAFISPEQVSIDRVIGQKFLERWRGQRFALTQCSRRAGNLGHGNGAIEPHDRIVGRPEYATGRAPIQSAHIVDTVK